MYAAKQHQSLRWRLRAFCTLISCGQFLPKSHELLFLVIIFNILAENIREAVQETHERVDSLLDELQHQAHQAPKHESPEPLQQEEQYSPSVSHFNLHLFIDLPNLG